MTDEVVPHFHNEPGVPVIEIGAKKFMCIGALPPQDHPHVFCDMGEDLEYVCPYCSTLYRHNPALAPNEAPGGMRIALKHPSSAWKQGLQAEAATCPARNPARGSFRGRSTARRNLRTRTMAWLAATFHDQLAPAPS